MMRRYIRDRKLYLSFLAVTVIILTAVPFLYETYDKVCRYMTILVLFSGFALMIPDHLRYRKTVRELEKTAGIPFPDAPLPEGITDEPQRLYADLIRQYRQEYEELKEQTDRVSRYLLDTYILWAHQIKTPIAAMRLLLEDKQDPQLNEQLFHIEEYVNQLLYYFRSESISGDFVIRSCSVDEVVRAALRKYSVIFIRRKLKLEYEPVDLQVDTDEKWLGFVVEQLLSNATKYTQSGGIRIYGKDGCLVIEDTGIGIAPEDLKRIFEKGYTGLNGRQEHRSTGLGLYLCREILKKLGHDIRIESEAGKGTRAVIVFDPENSSGT